MWHERLLDQTEYLKLCLTLTMKTIGFGMPFGPFSKSTTGLVGGPQWGQRIGFRLHGTQTCFSWCNEVPRASPTVPYNDISKQADTASFSGRADTGHIAGVFGQRVGTPCHVWWFQWWLVGVYPPSFQEHWTGIFRFFMSGCLSQVEMSCLFCMGMVPVPPIISWEFLWVFMQNGILGCPKNWVNVLWPAYKMILMKNLQIYPAQKLCYKYMLGISPSHSHTLPVASNAMKNPTIKKGSCISGLGYTQQLDRNKKLKPLSWSPGCLRTGFPFPGFSTLPIYVLDWVQEFIPYHLYIYCHKLFCCENMIGTTSQH